MITLASAVRTFWRVPEHWLNALPLSALPDPVGSSWLTRGLFGKSSSESSVIGAKDFGLRIGGRCCAGVREAVVSVDPTAALEVGILLIGVDELGWIGIGEITDCPW